MFIEFAAHFRVESPVSLLSARHLESQLKAVWYAGANANGFVAIVQVVRSHEKTRLELMRWQLLRFYSWLRHGLYAMKRMKSDKSRVAKCCDIFNEWVGRRIEIAAADRQNKVLE